MHDKQGVTGKELAWINKKLKKKYATVYSWTFEHLRVAASVGGVVGASGDL